MATRVSAASIKEKNRRNTEKKARRDGGTFTNKAGKSIGISQSHQANKNAGVLASSGSPEAQALNASLPQKKNSFVRFDEANFANNPTAPTITNANNLPKQTDFSNAPTIANAANLPPARNDPNMFGADSISETPEQMILSTQLPGAGALANFGKNLGKTSLEKMSPQARDALLGAGAQVERGVATARRDLMMMNQNLVGNFDDIMQQLSNPVRRATSKIADKSAGIDTMKAIVDKYVPKTGTLSQASTTTTGTITANTKNNRIIKEFMNKHFGPRIITTTDVKTGRISQKIVTENGRLIRPFTVGLIIAGLAGNAGINFWGDWENSQAFGIEARDAHRDARFAETPEERAELYARADEMNQAAIEAFSFTTLETLGNLIPGLGTYIAAKNRWLPDIERRNQSRIDVLEDAAAQTEAQMSDEEYFSSKIIAEQEQARIVSESRIETEKILLQLQASAREAGRESDLKYYEKLYARQATLEKEKLAEQKEYWTWYFKYAMEMRANSDNVPSKLNFGLL